MANQNVRSFTLSLANDHENWEWKESNRLKHEKKIVAIVLVLYLTSWESCTIFFLSQSHNESKAKPKYFWSSLDTQLEIALLLS